jgi:hypothetical protein
MANMRRACWSEVEHRRSGRQRVGERHDGTAMQDRRPGALSSKIIITAMIAFFPVLANTIVGLRSAPLDQIDMLRAYTATEWQIFRMVRLPQALPFIFVELDVAVPAAVTATTIVSLCTSMPINLVACSTTRLLCLRLHARPSGATLDHRTWRNGSPLQGIDLGAIG